MKVYSHWQINKSTSVETYPLANLKARDGSWVQKYEAKPTLQSFVTSNASFSVLNLRIAATGPNVSVAHKSEEAETPVKTVGSKN